MTPKQLHQEAFVLDSHCDTPLMLYKGSRIGQRTDKGHVDLVRMKEGGVDASFFAIYVSNKWDPNECTYRALQLLARVYDVLADYPDQVALATSAQEARALKAQGKRALFLGMENGGPFQQDLSLLRLFYRMGVRYVTLTHAGNNLICDSCATKEKRWNGVSPYGKEVIAEMNRLGMLIDVAHISDDSFYDVLKYSTRPVVSTHSCCRALCDVPRNMTDDMIRALAAKDGVIQINFYPAFLDKAYATTIAPFIDRYEATEALFLQDPVKHAQEMHDAEQAMMAIARPSYKRIVDHIDHVVQLVGPRHVGLGSDFDGIEMTPEGLDDIAKMPVITEELVARGYSEEAIRGILGENFLRVLEQVAC